RLLRGVMDQSIDALEMTDPVVQVVGMVRHALESTGVPRSESMAEMVSFMVSEPASMIPVNRISAALYAFEAKQMANTKAKLKASFWLDVEMLSAVLPYCDAILTERHFAGALKSIRRFLPSECHNVRVLSVRELPAFVSYLEELIHAVPADQRAAADALYLGKRG
ncbi:MAG: hypothetical protein AAFV77_04890, partial [Planctomycetota bacterium]